MAAGVGSSGSGGQGFAFRLEGDGDSKIGNSDGDLHQVTGTLQLNDNVFFLANGRLGLGTDAPDYKLDIAGNIGINQYVYHNGDADTYINFTDDRIRFNAGGINLFGMHQKSSAPHQVTVNNGGNNVDFVVNDNSGDEYLRADASTARVGIGTDSPDYTLDVAGDIGIDTTLYHNGDDDTFVRFADDIVILKAAGDSIVRGDPANGKIYLNNGGHDLDVLVKDAASGTLLYTDAGNARVGIGTASPSQVLHVAGNLEVSGNDPRIKINGVEDSHPGLEFYEAGTRKWIVFNDYTNDNLTFKTNSTTRMSIEQAGDVGIGTTSPDEKLDVRGNLQLYGDAPELTVRRDNNADASTLQFQGSGGVVGAYVKFLGDESGSGGTNNDLALGTGATVTERIRIRGDGKIGIGTQSPASELHINGALTLTEKSSDPPNPSEGQSVLWMSDGTGTGDDGDILIKITAGGVTKTVTLVDFSAS